MRFNNKLPRPSVGEGWGEGAFKNNPPIKGGGFRLGDLFSRLLGGLEMTSKFFQ